MVDENGKADDDRKNEAVNSTEGSAEHSASSQLANILVLLERSVKAKDTKMIVGRLMRQTAAIRSRLDPEILTTFVEEALPPEHPSRSYLMSQIGMGSNAMEEDSSRDLVENGGHDGGLLPEVEAYTFLLAVLFLVDNNRMDLAKQAVSTAVKRLSAFNRRTLDGITAKLYFYFSWTHECTDSLAEIRGQLLALHRTTVSRHDEYGQEIILNLLLRNYLHFNLYDQATSALQAEKLRSRAQKSDVWRSTQQYCRYLFYLGRIRAVQLDYSDSKDCLQQALRKAPVVAQGFRVIVNKWLILVRLLLGEIPEHSEFQQLGLQKQLHPYFALTQAVRIGDLIAFSKVAEQFDEIFRKDKTHNLINRLRHNVIRTGLRRVNAAYSRIHLADVAKKLGLSSVEDTESILAKAIRDGGIEATIDHEHGWMTCKDRVDVYATSEPQSAFHARVAFCLDVHNEAVRAMQFEGDSKKKLETAETTRERAIQDEELAKQIQEEEGDDFS